MTIDDLLAEAAPLRLLDPEDPAAARLGELVDEINRLRAEEERAALSVAYQDPPPAVVEGADAEPIKRKPGRPRKDQA